MQTSGVKRAQKIKRLDARTSSRSATVVWTLEEIAKLAD